MIAYLIIITLGFATGWGIAARWYRARRFSQSTLMPSERGALSPGSAPADRGSILDKGEAAHGDRMSGTGPGNAPGNVKHHSPEGRHHG